MRLGMKKADWGVMTAVEDKACRRMRKTVLKKQWRKADHDYDIV